MASGEPERVETVVIGGGQAGLSLGYYLAQRGLPFVILDANERIGDAWRNRWDSLRLPAASMPWRGSHSLDHPTRSPQRTRWAITLRPSLRGLSCRFEPESE